MPKKCKSTRIAMCWWTYLLQSTCLQGERNLPQKSWARAGEYWFGACIRTKVSHRDRELLRIALWFWVIIIKHRNEFPGRDIAWGDCSTPDRWTVVAASQKRFFRFYHLTLWKTHTVFHSQPFITDVIKKILNCCPCCAELHKTPKGRIKKWTARSMVEEMQC